MDLHYDCTATLFTDTVGFLHGFLNLICPAFPTDDSYKCDGVNVSSLPVPGPVLDLAITNSNLGRPPGCAGTPRQCRARRTVSIHSMPLGALGHPQAHLHLPRRMLPRPTQTGGCPQSPQARGTLPPPAFGCACHEGPPRAVGHACRPAQKQRTRVTMQRSCRCRCC